MDISLRGVCIYVNCFSLQLGPSDCFRDGLYTVLLLAGLPNDDRLIINPLRYPGQASGTNGGQEEGWMRDEMSYPDWPQPLGVG